MPGENPSRDSNVKFYPLGEVARSYLNNGRPASVGETSMRDARLALEAQAYLNGIQQEAPLRTAAHGHAIYIDRGTTDWSAFEITSAGWKVEPRSPVPNLRSKRAAAFAEPTAPGSFAPLQRLLGHLDNDQFVLFVSWCLWALSPTGPYPILIVTGEAGSGKSTLVRLAQRLVDPVAGDLLQPPDNDRDLIAAARHGRALSFDNISRLRPELADSLCRLATGSEIGGRSLYTDHDTATFAACRPLILNGIPDLAARGDLADRSIVIRLTALQSRVTEREWRVEADRIGPATITALLDALVTGIARIEEVTTPNVRMADFASMIVAAEQSLPWKEGAFLRAYADNRRDVVDALVSGDVVALMVLKHVEQHPIGWSGLMSDLYDELTAIAVPDGRRPADWPGNARWLSDRLRRTAPALRQRGIEISERRGSAGACIEIKRTADLATLATFATQTEAVQPPETAEDIASVASVARNEQISDSGEDGDGHPPVRIVV